MSDYIRRLPVYLLLDCSGSMSGEPIEAVKQGIKALLTELKGDPQALETACLSACQKSPFGPFSSSCFPNCKIKVLQHDFAILPLRRVI